MEDLVAIAKKLTELFEDRIADPEVFPQIFAYQVKLAKYQLFLDQSPEPE